MGKFLMCISLCLFFICCNKSNTELSRVERFINLLKEDKNQRIKIPDFNSDDINELLKYRSDEQHISNFPPNPLSSFVMEEVTIGMYALWQIETIRLRAINLTDAYLFASLNPRIVRESNGEVVNQDEILPEVASAYVIW